jgi:hypothetical protein
MTNIDITPAVVYLDAVQVSPRRWEHYACETCSYWRVSRKDLEALAEALEDGTPDAYSLWCSGGHGTEVRKR